MLSENGSSTMLWELPGPRPEIASRIGMAGDFLPAGILPHPRSWEGLSAAIAPHFQDLTVAICNLECPLATDGLEAMPLGGLGSLVSAPVDALGFLPTSTRHVLSVANNHTYNYGPEGAQRTRKEILRHGMLPLGSECTLQEPPETTVVNCPDGQKVGFWAAANITREPATSTKKGVDIATFDRGLAALDAMKGQGAKFCCALLHAGLMRTDYPDPEDVSMMDKLAKAGFDMIGASHSHRISGYRILSRQDASPAFCFYGLGTLVWNGWSSALEREGLLPVACLDRDGRMVRLEVRTIWLDDKGLPTIPDIAHTQQIWARVNDISAAIENGSYRRRFYKDMSPGLVQNQLRDILAAYRQTGVRGVFDKFTRLRMRHVRRLVHKASAR